MLIAISIMSATSLAQSTSDKEEFECNRRLAKSTQSYVPKDGYVPDEQTATAIAYAIALPIFGSKQLKKRNLSALN
jgi:hypothetical protein